LPPETLSAWNIPGAGGLALGSYPPAIVDGGHTSVKAVQDEPFGPPLAVETFRAEQEAITLANHRLRLARAVRTDDGARAQRGRGYPAGHRVD
jgi:betaine-aldehyde dehydrogenase